MTDGPLGIPVALCTRMAGMDFIALESLCQLRIDKDREALSQRYVSEQDSQLLRGRIDAYRELLRLSDQVNKTLQQQQK